MIGERLEEARKRKGVSIREVAEATKIRGDYLLAMEDNSFEIPLPQIYIRGFLKNYARYLQLDSNKILTDYDAHLLGRSNRGTATATRSQRESYGHVEIPVPEEEEEEAPEERVVITEAPEEEDDGPEPELRFSLEQKPEQPRKTPPPPTLDRQGTRHDQESWNENKTLYMKIGVILAAIILISTIMVVLIQLLRSKPETPAINPDLASTSTAEPSKPTVQTTPSNQLQADSFSISATDDVTLIIEQTVDRKRLWSGTLNAGETISLDKEGPVSIRFTNGSALTIEKDGQKVRPPQEGVGRTVVD